MWRVVFSHNSALILSGSSAEEAGRFARLVVLVLTGRWLPYERVERYED
jgi:hypothetical protein